MAKKYSLNDKSVRDFGEKTPLIPPVLGRTVLDVESLIHYADDYGKAYYHLTGVVRETTQDGVRVGTRRRRTFQMPTSPSNEKVRLNELCRAVAAMVGEDWRSEDFDADQNLSELADASAQEQFPEGVAIGIEVTGLKAGTNAKGEPVEYAQYAYDCPEA